MTEKRVFVGVAIPGEAREAVANYIDRLRAHHGEIRVRWLPKENLHITLRFVGNVSGAGLTDLEERVKEVAVSHNVFDAELHRTGNFAKRRIRANALWIGIRSENDKLNGLAASLMGAHEREFVPHLSIARLKDAAKGKEPVAEHLASEFGPITFHVDELVIYESTLTPTGSVYNVLSRHPLRAG